MAARGVCTSSRAGSAGTANVVTLTFPVGTVAGDRIACATVINNVAGTVVASTNAGAHVWTATSGPTDLAATVRSYYFERVLDATDIASGLVTFTWSGTAARIQAMGQVWPAGDPSNPFGTFATTTSSVNTATAPALTTVSAYSDVALTITTRVAAGNFAGVIVQPAAYTEDADVITTVATNANTEASTAHLTTPVVSGSSVGGGSLTSGTQATHWFIYLTELRSLSASSSPALSGSGALTAAGTLTSSGTAGPSGTGTLTASGGRAVSDTAALSGSGTLSASGTANPQGSASLSGSGTLSASGGRSVSGTASLSGSGALTASGIPVPSSTASLSGTGTLSASGSPTVVSAAVLSGDGTLTVVGVPSLSDVASLTGDGTLTATAVPILVGAAILSGLGILTAIGVKRSAPRNVTVTGITEHARATTLDERPRTTTLLEHPRLTTITDRSQT